MSGITLRGLDDRSIDVHTRPGRCRHIVDLGTVSTLYCGAPAIEHWCEPGGTRPTERACYCDDHGGAELALARLQAGWSVRAPLSVSDVTEAGTMTLASPEAVVVLRREQPEQLAERWDVRVSREQAARICERPGYAFARRLCVPSQSFGARAEAQKRASRLAELDPERETPRITHHTASVRERRRPWLAQLGIGGMIEHVGAFASREEALAAALVAWRQRVDATVAAITRARGGTLEWGLAIEPRSAPIVVEPREGEGSWDAYARTVSPVRVRGAQCWLRGPRQREESQR